MAIRVRKISVWLPSSLVDYADTRADRDQTSRSQVIGQALAEAKARDQARLAAEGYRFYAGEASEFSEVSAFASAHRAAQP